VKLIFVAIVFSMKDC